MTAATAFSSQLGDRLLERLGRLYGARAGEAMRAVTEVCARRRSTLGRPPRRWNERDAVLIAYPDHVRRPGRVPIASLREWLTANRLAELFSVVHVLPFFPSSGDDGFSVIDHRQVAPTLGSWSDIDRLAQGFELGVDLVLNHASRESAWFRAYQAGVEPYARFFVEADPAADLSLVVRPRSTPLLSAVETSRGRRHVWTTFSDDQVDLDLSEPAVLAELVDLLLTYVEHGARLVRLDAVAFVWKELGTTCVSHPKAHDVVGVLRDVLDAVAPGTWLLTETNVPRRENEQYWGHGDEAHLIYNFALAPMLLDAMLSADASMFAAWLADSRPPPPGTSQINFTASHDGIGLRPVEDLLPRARVDALVQAVQRRGGAVSTRTAASRNAEPYELNITLFDAIADPTFPESTASVARFVLSQGLAMSLRGIPAAYLPSLLGARNDISGVLATGAARSINRHKYTWSELAQLTAPGSTGAHVMAAYRHLLSVRRTRRAFHPDAEQHVLHIDHPAVLGLCRTAPGGEDQVVVLANLGPSPAVVSVDWHQCAIGADLVSGRVVLGGGRRAVLGPYQLAWLPVDAGARFSGGL